MSGARKRGKCSVCGFSARLVASGAVTQRHWVYQGDVGLYCPGSGLAPRPAAPAPPSAHPEGKP